MAKWLIPTDAEHMIRLDVTATKLHRFAYDYVHSIWDNVTGLADADYLMVTGTETYPGGLCYAKFTAMREVDGPLDWRKVYTYVGNPLAANGRLA